MKKLILLIACMVIFVAGTVAQTTHYVSKTGDNDDNGGTSPADAWETIQFAIDEADIGDIIIVAPGVYEEMLYIPKPLTIEGIVDGEQRVVIRPANPSDPGPLKVSSGNIITVTPDGVTKNDFDFLTVTIKKLVLDGEANPLVYTGIHSRGVTLNLDEVTIRNIIPSDTPSKYRDVEAYGINALGGKLSVQNSAIHDIHLVSENFFNLTDDSRAVGIFGDDLQGLIVKDTEISGIFAGEGDASGISLRAGFMPVPPYFKDGQSKTELLHAFEVSGNTIHEIRGGEYAAGIYSTITNDLLIHENEIKNIAGDHKALGIAIESSSIFKSTQANQDVQGFMRTKTGEVAPDVEISGNTIEQLYLGSMPSIGIYLLAPGKLYMHDNVISAGLMFSKAERSGPEIGAFLLSDDMHLLNNTFDSCIIGMLTFYVGNLHLEENAFNEPLIGVFAIDHHFRAKKMPDQLDLPFELPAPPEHFTAQKMPVMGNLKFTDNVFTGGQAMSLSGIFVSLEGMLWDLKAEEPDLNPGPRFLAQGNLIENFLEGITMNVFGEALAEISQGNIIQNNYSGIRINYSADPGHDIDKGLLLPAIARINHNIIQGNEFGVYYENRIGDVKSKPEKLELLQPKVDATFNYWGREEGPLVIVGSFKTEEPRNGVSHGVMYSPWLGFEPDTPPGQMTYYVDDSGSIQDAIDMASSGDIIRILGGDYLGDIVVGQGDGLTLYPGDSPACVIIDGDLTAASGNTLLIDMEGLIPKCFASERKGLISGEYTQVYVIGTADLNGITLDLNLGFAPEVGDEFVILYSDHQIQGAFSQGHSITVEYGGTQYTFKILYNIEEEGQVQKDNGTYMVVLELQQLDEPVAVPLSGWAIALGMLLMAGFVAFRFRL